MDNTLGVGAALAAMTPDDGQRYAGTLMLSALPNAPTVGDRTSWAARIRRAIRRRTGQRQQRGDRRDIRSIILGMYLPSIRS